MFSLTALFSIIAAPVETETLEDTAEMKPIVLHSRAITSDDTLLGYAGLIGRLVDYQPFDADNVWTLGHIRDVQTTRFGLRFLVEPNKNEAYSLITRWRSLEQVEMAWFDVEDED